VFYARLLGAGGLLGAALVAMAAAAVPGDANCDGRVNAADGPALTLAVFDGTTCARADVNGDGRITAADLPRLVAILTAPPPTATPVPTATPTPPPTPTR